jgi:hypothetical protein
MSIAFHKYSPYSIRNTPSSVDGKSQFPRFTPITPRKTRRENLKEIFMGDKKSKKDKNKSDKQKASKQEKVKEEQKSKQPKKSM